MKRIAALIAPYSEEGRRLLLGVRDFTRDTGDWRVRLGFPRDGDLTPVPDWGPDGVIVHPTSEPLGEVAEWGLPVVSFGGAADARIDQLTDDLAARGRLAAQHLRERGYTRLAMVAQQGGETWRGYREAAPGAELRLLHTGLHREWDLTDWDAPQIRETLTRWLADQPRPLGLFAARDSFGRHLLEACEELGRRVPDDVAVLSMGNNRLQCETALPTLSSIEGAEEQLGYRAAATLSARLTGNPPPTLEALPPPRVVVRQSTDAVATDDPEVVAAMRYMRQHLTEALDTTDIARAMGISQRSLERHFKRELGNTPGHELTRLRLERAEQLLADPDRSVASVAEACGFGSAQQLGRRLKQRTGRLPSEYRRRRDALEDEPSTR